MARRITLKMAEAADIQAVIDALPPVNSLDLSTNKATQAIQRLNLPTRLYLQDLGIREIGYARRRAVVGQAIYMEPWDGTSGVIDIDSYLLGVIGQGHTAVETPIKGLDIFNRLPASDANFGRIQFQDSDEVRRSLATGMAKLLLDLGIIEIEDDQAQDLEDSNALLVTANEAFLAAEPLTRVEVEETLVAATDANVPMTAVIPAGAIIESVRANNETVISFNTATAHTVGITGTLDKYIDDNADITADDKHGGLIGAAAVLASAETLTWYATNGSGAAAGDITGTLRIKVTYLIAADLADA